MTLTERQLELLRTALHQSADEASVALGRWIGRPTRIAFDAVEQLPLDEATRVLGPAEEPVCFCSTAVEGRLTGHLILAFDDASGLALADMLLSQPRGTATDWGEMETSAALETTNILCCAYLNTLHRVLPSETGGSDSLLPSPPRFARDFAASLIEFALMDQLVAGNEALLARTEFHIDGAPVDWKLLLVPDAPSLERLGEGGG